MKTKNIISAALVSLAAFAFTGCGSDDETFIKVLDKKVQYTHYGMIEARVSGETSTPDTPIDSLGNSFDMNLTKNAKKNILSNVKGVYKEPYYMVKIKSKLKFDDQSVEMINTDRFTKYPQVEFNKKFLDTLKTYNPSNEFMAWLATKASMTMDPTSYKDLQSTNKEMNCFDKDVVPELIKAAKAAAGTSCKGSYCTFTWNKSLMAEVSIKNPFTQSILNMLTEGDSYSADYKFENAINSLVRENEGNCNFAGLIIDLALDKHAAAFVKMGHKNYAEQRLMTEEENDAIVDAIKATYEVFDDIPTL